MSGPVATPTLARLRREMLAYAARLHARGWVANHDGNLSARIPGTAGRFLVTPTAMSKGALGEADLVTLDRTFKPISGRRKPPSEVGLHKIYYAARPDAQAVIHAHPPAATALAVAGVEVCPRIIAEAVVSLGDAIPMVPYALPGSDKLHEALRSVAAVHDAVTMEHHGVLCCGDDLEQAWLRLELVEHLARIQIEALRLGPLRTIGELDLKRLREARTKAGLGPEGRARRKA